ncbi:MAG: hypothetical protein M1816_006725 [Peltula sp. TS41687]|nr:MAG: hypothetical protein M1816_006725 [Peltula sp. TS41687]
MDHDQADAFLAACGVYGKSRPHAQVPWEKTHGDGDGDDNDDDDDEDTGDEAAGDG